MGKRKKEVIDQETKDFYDKYKEKITCAYNKDIYVDSEGKERCGAKRTEERDKYLFHGLTEDIALVECPLDMLALEFETHNSKDKKSAEYKEVSKEQIKEWIKQVVENAKSNKIDYCVCDHTGTSPYFYACNIQNLIENREAECKKEIAKILIPAAAIDFLDFSNLGKTLIPIINMPHWKKTKYNGEIHKIIEGKHPVKHKNKVPEIVLQRVFDNERPKTEGIKISGDSDINSIPLTSIISTAGLKKRGQEYQGANVWHGSGTGMNFCVNPTKNSWYCFRCGVGGSVAKAIALNKGITRSCNQDLSPDQFKQVLQIAREDYGLKKPERKEPIGDIISGRFIFDSSKVVNPAIFSCNKIGSSFGYGFLLPKEVPVFDKDKKPIGRRQIRSPVIITSEGDMIEPSPENEAKFKIKYTAIPNELDLRIKTEVLEDFIKGKVQNVKGEELFNEMKKEGYEKFLFFQNPVWYDIHTLWDICTYFFELFNAFPILEMRGLSGSAKSKVMKVSRLYSLNPTEIMVNPSEASLFRITHTKRPTKYIDEAEKLFLFIGGQWQSSPVVELINGSYTRGSSVPRLEKFGNDFKMISYQCYSPTMIGSIAGLREATETRAITHIMTKAPDRDKRGELEVEDHSQEQIYQKIRNKLYLFAWSNWQIIERTYKELDIQKLKKRDLQLWKPVLTIAKTISEDLFERVLKFAEKVSEQRKQDFISEGTLDYKILKILKELLEAKTEPLYIKFITEKINEFAEKKTSGKTISGHLDKLGFKEFRTRDKNSSLLEINSDIYEQLVSPICPTLSTYSTYSTSDRGKEEKSDVEPMVNDVESSDVEPMVNDVESTNDVEYSTSKNQKNEATINSNSEGVDVEYVENVEYFQKNEASGERPKTKIIRPENAFKESLE